MEKTIKYDDLVAYLEDEDEWTRCEESNGRWLIFEGDYGTNGTPIQIVLPANDEATDVRFYLHSAVKTLAAIQGTPIEDMADLITPTSVKALMKAIALFDCEPGVFRVTVEASDHQSGFLATATFRTDSKPVPLALQTSGNSPEKALADLLACLQAYYSPCPTCGQYRHP